MFQRFKKPQESKKIVKNSELKTKKRKEKEEEGSSLLKIKINMESQFFQVNLLKLLLKWKFHLAVIVILAAGLAAVFSGKTFITPKFKSFAIGYPSNIASYSDENETEQMLQVLESKDISDSIIEKFNLPDHYEIDRDYEYYYSTLMDEYNQNVRIGKTPYEGVSIEVNDKNAQVACDMVNSILYFYNKKVRLMHEEKFGEVVEMFERALAKKENYLDSLTVRFTQLSTEYGLTDYGAQAEQVTKGYLKTLDGNGASHVKDKEVSKLKESLETKGAEMLILQNLLGSETRKYIDMKDEYEKAYMDYDRKFTYVNLISEPFPADKKAYPIRWLIVFISALASFFVAFIIILILENYKGLAKNS